MFVLNTGSLKCTKVFAGNTEPTFLKDYVPGEGFGELALLYNAPRAATISATSDSTLMKLDRGTFNHIVKDSAQRKREKYDNFLQSVAILESMDPYERSKLGDAVHEERYPEGEYVIKQGTAGETFYMVLEGTLKALRRGPDGIETEVMQYEPGKYFGERALLTNDLRAASIMTTSDVCVLSLERSTFMRLLGPLDDILKRNMEAYKKYA
uniref:Cyclic nucleotide-binding domain-containing protein n=1 Tax=Favella ehrenbergii TaxID=182087 RepID=A0A7S3HVW2_9SPIT|mmetsp:Transcript_1479/g.2152  ORF Transcript_1479/g.2152 Transcript_1479/m.2152 type:complete len:210 (+) Transcript_1479:557-1186(+)